MVGKNCKIMKKINSKHRMGCTLVFAFSNFNRVPFFSSPEHKVLKVSYWGGPLSVVRASVSPCVRPASTISLNIFSSSTTGPNSTKLGRDVPCMRLYQNCSKNSIPCRTLVLMETERKIF